jgi:hypothetical protein
VGLLNVVKTVQLKGKVHQLQKPIREQEAHPPMDPEAEESSVHEVK